MESKQILDKLNQARRALDSLSQVEIMDEWQFDNELNVWYLHLSIVIECETPYFPQKSQWFFVVGSEYPKGKIKVYPDVENSIMVTLYHQANNSKIERNGLWRKGALCLEVNTIPNYQLEPYSVDERLLYHAKRAICWLQFNKHTLHSANLYQIFTYVKNKEYELREKEHTVSGMLLYAKTDEEIYPNNVYQMSGNQITVRTLDLNLPFTEIAEQLDTIAKLHFSL